MNVGDVPVMNYGTARAAITGLALALGLASAPQSATALETASDDDGIHLGVTSCASTSCHAAASPVTGSSIRHDEYLVWSQESDAHRIDKHHRAYIVLLGDQGVRIAHNLGLPDAVTADACLNCHTDNVPEARRGPQFKIVDGVGCETCHGGAMRWLGTHLIGAGHQANLAAGLYPTDEPIARAQRCLSCHLGDDKRVMTHEIMGAGHPRLSFELDTFTALEPAHYVVNRSYIERKGLVSGAKFWAVGQAVSLVKLMDRMIDPQNAPKGATLDLMLFDCEACHHGVRHLRETLLPVHDPGALRLNEANAVMLQVIATRVAPTAAMALASHTEALNRVTGEGWDAVRREARELRSIAKELIPVLAAREFTREDIEAMVAGVSDIPRAHGTLGYGVAEQSVLALEACIAAQRSAGYVSEDLIPAIDHSLDEVYQSLGNGDAYRPSAFVKAIEDVRKSIVPNE